MALPNPLEAFVWGPGGAQMTPEQIARQREIASALLNKAGDTSPVADWTQGAARVVNALGGVLKERRADKAEASNAANSQSGIAALLGGMTGGGAAQFPSAPGAPVAAAGGVPSQDVAAASPSYSPLAQGSDWLNYANQGATRNQPLNEKLVSDLGGFLPEMGVTMKVFSGGQDAEGPNRTGSHRHDHGNAADVFFYKDGRKLDWANPQDQPIFADIVRRGKAAGITGFGAGDGYMQPGSMHIGFGTPAVWGAGGRGSNAPDWLRSAFNSPADAAPAVAAVNALAQAQPTQVASNDPSIGMATPATQSPDGGYQVGGPASTSDAGNRVVHALINPQSMTGGAPMPLQGATPAPQSPQQSGAPQGAGAPGEIRRGADGQTYQYAETTGMAGATGANGWIRVNADTMVPQTAQAAPQDLSRLSPMAGGTAGTAPAGASSGGFNPGMQAAIARALSSPYASDGEKQIAGILLKQQMAQSDPANALDMEYKRAQLDALKNPVVKPTGDMQEYEFAKSQGFPGSFVDFMLAQKKAGATTISDIGNTKGETKFDQTMGEELAKKTIGILDAGQQAPTKIATYNQLLQTLPGMYTGTGGDTILSAKRALKGLGFDTGDLSGPEFIQAMGNQMALELRNPAGGAGMPGAMSDKDREFLASMSPGLTKTPEGNKKLLEYRIALEQRNQQVAQLANQYMSSHGGRIDNNFYSELSKWSNANPLFPDQPKKTVIDGYTIEQVE